MTNATPPIAGLEVGLPATIADITPEWMTAVLRTSGAIGDDGSVASIDMEPFAVGVGFLSLLHRATLRYDGAAGPATVIVKMVTDLEVQRGIADALLFYQRELRFYREVAPTLDFRTPVVHAGMMSEAGTDFVLVMEDLSHLRGVDQNAGATLEESMLAASTMAELHGRFSNEDLSDLETTFLPFDNPIYRAVLPEVFASGWEPAKTVVADLLTPEILAFGDRFAELVPTFMERIGQKDTLIHGDWRADNLLIDDNGEMVVLDFQITGTAVGIYDLAYFMSQSIEPEIRRGNDEALIQRYFETLGASGGAVDEAVLRDVFRTATAWCLIYPVSIFAGWNDLPEESKPVARSMLRRSVQSILDHDSLALFP